jgi:hypothetical protein
MASIVVTLRAAKYPFLLSPAILVATHMIRPFAQRITKITIRKKYVAAIGQSNNTPSFPT